MGARSRRALTQRQALWKPFMYITPPALGSVGTIILTLQMRKTNLKGLSDLPKAICKGSSWELVSS